MAARKLTRSFRSSTTFSMSTCVSSTSFWLGVAATICWRRGACSACRDIWMTLTRCEPPAARTCTSPPFEHFVLHVAGPASWIRQHLRRTHTTLYCYATNGHAAHARDRLDCRSVVHRSDWPRSALICELLRAGTTANSGCVVDDHPYICDRAGAAGQGVHLHAQRRPLQTEHCRCDRAAGRAASGRWRQWAHLLGQHCRHGGHCAGCV